jgi:hypothetical protein
LDGPAELVGTTVTLGAGDVVGELVGLDVMVGSKDLVGELVAGRIVIEIDGRFDIIVIRGVGASEVTGGEKVGEEEGESESAGVDVGQPGQLGAVTVGVGRFTGATVGEAKLIDIDWSGSHKTWSSRSKVLRNWTVVSKT